MHRVHRFFISNSMGYNSGFLENSLSVETCSNDGYKLNQYIDLIMV